MPVMRRKAMRYHGLSHWTHAALRLSATAVVASETETRIPRGDGLVSLCCVRACSRDMTRRHRGSRPSFLSTPPLPDLSR